MVDETHLTASPLIDGTTTTGAEIVARDWSSSSLGAIASWPSSLRTTLSLMLACPTPMFLAWGPDLLCFYNDAYRPILGYRLDTALGRPFSEVWDSIWTEIEPLVMATLAGRSQTLTDLPLDLSRRGLPEESWWSFTYSPAYDDAGRVAGMLCVTGETTAKVVAERDLRASNEEIQRYAYIVSHDLRAPLVNITGFTTEIEAARNELRPLMTGKPEGTRIDADLTEAIGFIKASVTKMDGLIAAILKLSREGRRVLKPEPLDMTTLIRRLADAIRHQTESVGAEITVAPGLPDLVLDRLAVEAVFGNLLDNAVKYLAPGRPGCIAVTGETRGSRAVFRVMDNGRGIAERDQARVFELFRRAGAQDRAGEGIGLAQVRATVLALGGRIDLASREGEGSTFTVALPVRAL